MRSAVVDQFIQSSHDLTVDQSGETRIERTEFNFAWPGRRAGG